MTIRRRTLVATAVFLLLIVGWQAGQYCLTARLTPERRSERLRMHFMGQAMVGLPNDFQVESGRVQMLCAGGVGWVSLVEVPYLPGDAASGQGLSRVMPESGDFRLVKDLSDDFNRPAQLVLSESEGDEAMASVAMNLDSGLVRISRLVKKNDQDEFPLEKFEREALFFSRNYSWGHSGGGLYDMHSLHGYLRPAQGCRDMRAVIKLGSPHSSVKAALIRDHERLEEVIRENGLELATAGDLANPPSVMGGVWDKGQWNRLVRGGPRRLSRQLGLEWVVLRRDFGTGRQCFAAIWHPSNRDMPVLVMTAAREEAALALSYWNDMLRSVGIVSDYRH